MRIELFRAVELYALPIILSPFQGSNSGATDPGAVSRLRRDLPPGYLLPRLRRWLRLTTALCGTIAGLSLIQNSCGEFLSPFQGSYP